MRTKVLLTIILNLILLATAIAEDLYVSPNGNDNNPGTKEKPLFTIEKAIKEVAKQSTDDCIIWLADGTYHIEKPLVFIAKELGAKKRQIHIKTIQGANPIISGGRQVTEWEKNELGIWEAKINSGESFRELFVEDKRATRARFPNEGYLRVKKVGKDRRTHFFFNK
ncbi:MAG: DUF1565 domain-containing protein [Draconibacterium sp.]|nr:DUF1565 domain-containing protein [Draconibacterium sp.]